jgi:Bacterial lectin
MNNWTAANEEMSRRSHPRLAVVLAWTESGPLRHLSQKICAWLALSLGTAVASLILSGCGGGFVGTTSKFPAITGQPAGATVQVGQTAVFNVTAIGAAPLGYQWLKNGSPIAGATQALYTTPPTSIADNGSLFTVVVINSFGTVTSSPATLTVTNVPLIVSQPADVTVVSGQAATFSVRATGSGPLNYQWLKNGSPIVEANASNYTMASAPCSDNGSIFSVIVSELSGSVTSAGATITVNCPPIIVTPPTSEAVITGQRATFFVAATGVGPLAYQWLKNGVPIPAAKTSSYTTPAALGSDSGALFSVIVSNGGGYVISPPATLTISSPPAMATQPASQTVTAGQSATFSVTATGTAPLTYQWYKNGAAIGGANANIYTSPAVAIKDNGSTFAVVVLNAFGTATSAPAVLTVVNTAHSPVALVCTPSTPPYRSSVTLIPSFSAGTAVIGSSGIGSSDISTSVLSESSYPTPKITAPETYTLTVTGKSGQIVSTACAVTPETVTITPISPAGQTVPPGPLHFNATVSGGATDAIAWTATGGSFAGSLWTSPAAPGAYTIRATSVDDPTIFVSTTVIVSAPVILQQPVNLHVCSMASATLSVTADYVNNYQWNFNGVPIPGATSSSYVIAEARSANAGRYTVTVTNEADSVVSNAAQVVVGSSIVSNPRGLTIYATQTATFSVSAEGISPFTYQWYHISGGARAIAILDATSSSYTTLPATTNMSGDEFYVIVNDMCASELASSTATLTVAGGNAPPTIITNPLGQIVPVGASPTLNVVASGTPALSYQWYLVPKGSVTGNKIAGAVFASYTVPATSTTVANDQDAYYVTVSNAYGLATSQTATLSIGNGILIDITKEPIDAHVQVGDSASFSVSATSNLALSYQWWVALPGSSLFNAVPGATSSTLAIDSATLSDASSVFYVVVSNGSTSPVTSSSASLFVGALPTVPNLCGPWSAVGDAIPLADCGFQLTAAAINQHGEIVWPYLISTDNLQMSFTIATSAASSPPADGFALVLGDPSLGATVSSLGATGKGLGAEGIPGLVIAFDDFYNPPAGAFPGDPGNYSNPAYIGAERGETALWEDPYFNVKKSLPGGASALAQVGATVSHSYMVSIVQGHLTVIMDGTQIFSGTFAVPPVAYLYFTASTGTFYEQTIISGLSTTLFVP